MVVTVGTSPVPVLLTICQHEPSVVWLVHTGGDRGTASHARRIAEVLREHQPGMTVQLVDLDAAPGDFVAVRESLARPRADLEWPPRVPWRCDYTGGTAVMAVELVAAHLAAHGPSRAGWRSYWDEAGGQVRYDGGDYERCRVPEFFNLVTVARLHGFTWRNHRKFRSFDTTDTSWAEDVCRRAHQVLTGRVTPEEVAGPSAADAALVAALSKPEGDSGSALELVVAALLVRAGQLGGDLPRPDEVMVSFEVEPTDIDVDEDHPIEIDVVARYGQQILVISCKNTNDALKKTEKTAAAVGKVYQEAQALYGGATRRVLITTLAKSGAVIGGSPPVEPGFTELLLGPGLIWRSPYVLTETDFKQLLGEVAAPSGRPRRTPGLDRMLRNQLGLGDVARYSDAAPRDEIGLLDQGLTLVTTLSGNVLAMVASGRGLPVRHVAVLEAAGRAGADRHLWAAELQRVIGVTDATIDRVPVGMSDVPDLISRITRVLDSCARAGQPAVIDITGGTKAVSVAGYLAASAVGDAEVRVCYSDIYTNQRRWLDGKSEPLTALTTSIEGLLNLRCHNPGSVEFPPVDLDEFFNSRHQSENLLAEVIQVLRGALVNPVLVRPRLVFPGEAGQDRDWLPRCGVLIAGNRLIGLYAHGNLTNMRKGLGKAMFVDALVAALGGDTARSLFITSQDQDENRDLANLESGRLRALVRRPFPPKVLCRSDAEDVIHNPAKLAELVRWMTE